jgi:hypothetical protein
MKRHQVRQLKSHFGARWAELRHLHKTGKHVLCYQNKYILNHVLPGPVLALDCLGELYQGILDIDTEPKRDYETLLLINNIQFKYLTVEQLANTITQYQKMAKRIIVNFNFHFLIYDRLSTVPTNIADQLKKLLHKHFNLEALFLSGGLLNHGYGNTFLVLDVKNG